MKCAGEVSFVQPEHRCKEADQSTFHNEHWKALPSDCTSRDVLVWLSLCGISLLLSSSSLCLLYSSSSSYVLVEMLFPGDSTNVLYPFAFYLPVSDHFSCKGSSGSCNNISRSSERNRNVFRVSSLAFWDAAEEVLSLLTQQLVSACPIFPQRVEWMFLLGFGRTVWIHVQLCCNMSNSSDVCRIFHLEIYFLLDISSLLESKES